MDREIIDINKDSTRHAEILHQTDRILVHETNISIRRDRESQKRRNLTESMDATRRNSPSSGDSKPGLDWADLRQR